MKQRINKGTLLKRLSGLCAVTTVMMTTIVPANATFIDYGSYLTDTNTGLDWMDITPTIGMSFGEALAETRRGGRFEGWRSVSSYPRANANGVWQLTRNWIGIGTLPSGVFRGYVNSSALNGLIEILGPTSTYVARFSQPDFGPKRGQTVTEINAITNSSSIFGRSGSHYTSSLWVSSNSRGLLNGEVNLWAGLRQDNLGSPSIGTFLVRDSINMLTQTELFSNPDSYEFVRVPSSASNYFKYIGVVPEPAPFAVLIFGLAGLGLARWRRG